MIKIQIPSFNSVNNYRIKHAFLCNVRKSDNFSEIIRKNFNNTEFALLKQIHSNVSYIMDRRSYYSKEGDAMVTRDDTISLCVFSADCVPVLLADSVNKVIGSVHVGWRGAKSKVIESAMLDMLECGAKVQNITAAIGPTIIQDNYQVGIGFYQQFISDNKKNEKFFKKNHGVFFFDLCSYVRQQLLDLNISSGNIFNCNLDTYSNIGIASFRRFNQYNLPNDFTNLTLIALRAKSPSIKPFIEKTNEWISLSSEVKKVKNNKIIQKYNEDSTTHEQSIINYDYDSYDDRSIGLNINDEDLARTEEKKVVYLSDYEEREILKKLKNKKIRIERKIDLHGKNVDEAYTLLKEFLSNCYYAGSRYLLVIVGKGKNGEGIIRSKLKEWIENDPEICEKVMFIKESLPEHGGDGSYYVFFRRKKI